MAKRLLIVHGYSDGSTSFTGLGDFLIAKGLYKREDVFYLDYSSMDDQATFRDFADKLDADRRTRLGNERVDVACHSTGSLVVRAWLALHAQRTRSGLHAGAADGIADDLHAGRPTVRCRVGRRRDVQQRAARAPTAQAVIAATEARRHGVVYIQLVPRCLGGP